MTFSWMQYYKIQKDITIGNMYYSPQEMNLPVE